MGHQGDICALVPCQVGGHWVGTEDLYILWVPPYHVRGGQGTEGMEDTQ